MLHGREISLSFDLQEPVDWFRHRHKELQIALLFNPADCELTWWTAQDEARHQRLTGREVWFIPPGVWHSSRWKTKAHLLVLYVPRRFLRRMKQRLPVVLIDGPSSFVHHDPIVWTLAATIRFLCDECDRPDISCIDSLTEALAQRLLKAHGGNGPPGGSGRLPQDKVRRITGYILSHLTDTIRVPDLAKLVGVSLAHFNDLFKAATKQTPAEYVRQIRLMRAQELIISGEASLTEVADVTGFADQSHLTRWFRKTYGITPKMLMERASAVKRAKKS